MEAARPTSTRTKAKQSDENPSQLLPDELIERYKDTPLEDVRKEIRPDIFESVYWDGWENRANVDFGFPITTFPLAGPPNLVPFERYLYISRLAPVNKVKYLNEICQHWDLKTESTNFNPDLDEKYEKMTEEQWDEIAQEMADNSGDDFTISNHLIITFSGRWSRLNVNQNDKYTRVAGRDNLTTLVRGYKKKSITYEDILTASRVFFRTDSASIVSYEFKGFSQEGFPILSIEINW